MPPIWVNIILTNVIMLINWLIVRWKGKSYCEGSLQWTTCEDYVYVGFVDQTRTQIFKFSLSGILLDRKFFKIVINSATVKNNVLYCICDHNEFLKIYDFNIWFWLLIRLIVVKIDFSLTNLIYLFALNTIFLKWVVFDRGWEVVGEASFALSMWVL